MFDVIRRCDVCEDKGCNCDHIPVRVDVDELTDVEAARFLANGTSEQRAEIAAYLRAEAA